MKIGVVGLGLIGGSIFKSLKEKYEVLGVSSSVQEENVSKEYSSLSSCDVVFVCTPMHATIEILEKLNKILSKDTLVTDVCSLKGFVSNKKYNFKFIPSHPMAGTEHSGWNNSFPELFQNAKWVLTPLAETSEHDLEVLEGLIKELGAKPIITTPEEHDKAVALISHMPMVVAQALCKNIKDEKLAQALAASGFRDTTRLALSNLEMAEDMVTMNFENIQASVKNLIASLEALLADNYPEQAKEIKDFRQNLYN